MIALAAVTSGRMGGSQFGAARTKISGKGASREESTGPGEARVVVVAPSPTPVILTTPTMVGSGWSGTLAVPPPTLDLSLLAAVLWMVVLASVLRPRP